MTFPDLAWDASLYALTVLAEFVQPALIGGHDWVTDTALTHTQPTTAELDELARLAEYRAEVMSEALAQSMDMVGYWAGLLMFGPSSHPWTFRLARTAIVVGEFVAMYYKRKFNRPRPSQLSPALMPPIAVPGHASYPSGHATQAYLLSLILTGIIPGVVSMKLNPTIPGGTQASLLDRLAERVARNREVLGVHYRTDSEAGKTLATSTYALLKLCPAMKTVGSGPGAVLGAFDKAKLEWPS